MLIYKASVLAQTPDDALQFFDWLTETNPGRIVLVLGSLLIIAIILTQLHMTRSVTANVKAQDEQVNLLLGIVTGLTNAVATLNTTLSDHNNRISDDYLAIKTLNDHYLGRVTDSVGEISDALVQLGNLKGTLDESAQSYRDHVSRALTETHLAIARTIAAQKAVAILGFSFAFPDDNDPRWHIAKIWPLSEDYKPRLLKAPLWDDNSTLGYLQSERIVRIIDRSIIVEGFYSIILNFEEPRDDWVRAWVYKPSVAVASLSEPHISSVEADLNEIKAIRAKNGD